LPGLLDRAKKIRNTNFPPAISSGPDAIVIEEFDDPKTLNFLSDSDSFREGLTGFHEESFISALRLINDGIEMPGEMFDAFCQHLLVDTGSLLFLDQDTRMFAPWVSKGLDETTSHRLRLPLELILSIFDNSKDPVFLNNGDKESFRNYLSIRLFDLTDTVTLIPIFSKDQLFGLIMVCDSRYSSDPGFPDYLKFASEIIGRSIEGSRFSSRSSLNLSLSTQIQDNNTILSIIDTHIQEALNKSERLTFIIFDINSIIQFIEEQHSGLDSYRIKKDILALLNTMIQGIGEVFDLADGKALLELFSKTPLKENLLLNQIQISIQSFFHHQDYFPKIKATIKRIPDDGMESSILRDYL